MESSNIAQLYLTIAKDLNIPKFTGEKSYDYAIRLVYSALGYWILNLSQDRTSNYEDRVSKAHVTISAMNILTSLINLDPYLEIYFNDHNRGVKEIEETYEALGFFKSGDYSLKNIDRLVKIRLNDNQTLKISHKIINPTMVGLGYISNSNKNSIELSSFFKIKTSALEAFTKMINILEFKKFDYTKGLNEIYNFQKHRWDPYSESLVKKYEYSILKIDKGLKYGIVCIWDNVVNIASLPLIYTKQVDDSYFKREVWRIILGIAAYNKLNLTVYKKQIYDEACSYEFWGYVLPTEEMSMVKSLSWPLVYKRPNSDNNQLAYVVPNEYVYNFETILERLNLKIVEVKNG